MSLDFAEASRAGLRGKCTRSRPLITKPGARRVPPPSGRAAPCPQSLTCESLFEVGQILRVFLMGQQISVEAEKGSLQVGSLCRAGKLVCQGGDDLHELQALVIWEGKT